MSSSRDDSGRFTRFGIFTLMASTRNTLRLIVTVLVVGAVIGSGVAAKEVIAILNAAREPSPTLFNYGLAPAIVSAPEAWTNDSCKECHAQIFEQWSTSRHAKAADNDHFEVELLDPGNRQQYCLNCHAPRTPGEALFPTQEPAELDSLFTSRPEWLRAGVDCLTCHVRDGKILATQMTDEAAVAHPLLHAPELGRAEFCSGCHQFALKSLYFPDNFRGHFQQASLDEFIHFRSEGNDVSTCHECHMDDGDHRMSGGYSNELLKSAVDLRLDLHWDPQEKLVEIDVTVEGGYVGHRIPGGEWFRFVSVVTTLEDANGRVLTASPNEVLQQRLAASGKTYVMQWPRREKMRRSAGDFEMGKMDADPRPDTRLFPEESRVYRYATTIDPGRAGQPVRARAVLLYHLMGASKAKRFHHLPRDVMSIVHEAEETIDLQDAARSSEK